jgi:hypothetical protein
MTRPAALDVVIEFACDRVQEDGMDEIDAGTISGSTAVGARAPLRVKVGTGVTVHRPFDWRARHEQRFAAVDDAVR